MVHLTFKDTPILFISIRYDTEFDTDLYYRYCDVIKLTGKSRDLVDQVQSCLTVMVVIRVVIQFFLME